MTARPRPLAVIVNTLVLWVTIAIASVVLWPIYQGPAIVVLVVVTTVVASAIAILGAIFRWSAPVVLFITCAAFVLLGVPLAVPQETLFGYFPSLEGLRQLVAGVALGWKQLLTITLPVGNYQALLVPPFVLILVLVVIALTLALRSRFGGLAVIAPVVVFVFGVVFGPESTIFPIELTLALLFTCLLWLMWRRWYARRRAIEIFTRDAAATGGSDHLVAASEHRIVGVRTVVSGVVILALAGGAATAAALVIPPDGRRSVLRSSVEQPFDPRDYVSPLAGFRSYLLEDAADEVLFTIDGLTNDSRIRIATLDSYDGVVYAVGSEEVNSASGSFTRVPFRFDQSSIDGEEVDLDVTILGYTGVWMPTVGKLESVTFSGSRTTTLRDSFYYNDVGGTAAIVGGLREGDGYRLEAVVPQEPSEQSLTSAQPGSASVPPLGALPAELEAVLSGYTEDVEGAGAQLVAMVDGLRANGYISHGVGADEPASRSGHSSDRVTQLLTDQRMIGDAEQYAVTAAIMARQLGFPARVVFGFVPTSTSGSAEITGSQVSAWIEVNTERNGWVTIDPVPPVRDIPDEEPEDPTVVSRPQPVVPPQVTDPVERPVQTPLDSAPDEQQELPGWLVVLLTVARILGGVVLVLAVILAPFLLVLVAKWRRRRARRRAPTPLARIRGGWQEYADAVVDHGYEPPGSATRREIAATVGGGKAAVLAAVTDRAVFSPIDPAPEDADKVWRAVSELNAKLDAGRTRWERIKARISMRSLGGYSVTKLFRRQG
jgi:hypothetical protein